MKLAREYAQVLRDLPDKETSANHFLQLLKRRGHLTLLPQILAAFDRLEAKAAKTAANTLVIAREKDAAAAKKELLAKGIEHPEVQVDHTLIGGWRFVGPSMLIDATYKRALLDLYRKMTA